MAAVFAGLSAFFLVIALTGPKESLGAVYGARLSYDEFFVSLLKPLIRVPYVSGQLETIRKAIRLLGVEKEAEVELGRAYAIAILALFFGFAVSPFFLPFVLAPNLTVIRYDRLLANEKKRLSRSVLRLSEMTAFGVSAGLSPLQALERALEAVGRIGEGRLVSELLGRARRARFGEDARTALLRFVDEVELPEVRVFIERVVDAFESGSGGFSEDLGAFVRHLRELRLARIEKEAEVLEQKLTLPVGIMFYAVFMLLLLPLIGTFLDANIF